MLLIRAALLEFLVVFHVIGGAVLFRRLFPRESPWLAFILPTLIVMAAFNFIEHGIGLPNLGWLLPLTLGGLLWVMITPGGSKWLPGYKSEGLWLPGILFVLLFTWAFFIKLLNPAITNNTEGVADMARVLDFCFGDKLPPTDNWMPPYDHSTYYSFQHYGASILTRLFSLDIGTGYNMGYTLLNTLTCLVAAGVAYVVSGNRIWVSLVTLLIIVADFSGSTILMLLMPPSHLGFQGDYTLNDLSGFIFHQSVDLGDGWDDANSHNPFKWIFKGYLGTDQQPPALRMFPSSYNLWFPEFHPNLGGHFVTLATLLAAFEAYRENRSNWPWICLFVFPFIAIITSTWFFLVVAPICVGSLLLCLITSKRPESWKFVLCGTALAAASLWPNVNALLSGTYPNSFHWTWELPGQFTPFWEFVVQWWTVILPWFLLCFVWFRLNLMARFIHALVPLLLAFVEIATFGEVRMVMIEKVWGALYGVGLAVFLPLVFTEAFRSDAVAAITEEKKRRSGRFDSILHFNRRILKASLTFTTVIFLFFGLAVFAIRAKCATSYVDWKNHAFRIKGDSAIEYYPQKWWIMQALERLHGAIVLSRCDWSYNEAPSAIDFSGNRCYIAWFYQEYQIGHGGVKGNPGEAEYRNQVSNDFYDGKLADPLAFLRSRDIAAVVIWPEEDPALRISDENLAKLTSQISSDYYYLDCKLGGPSNAGVFFRLPHPGEPTGSLPKPPTP